MATKLEELVVKLSADLSDLKSGLAEASNSTKSAADGISRAIDGMAQNSGKSFGSFKDIANMAMGVFTGEALLEAVNKTAEVIGDFFKDTLGEGVREAEATEDQLNKVNFALASAGQYSRAASDDMVKFSGSMQDTTKYSDDAVLSASALIESLGQLDRNSLKGATKSAMDLSSALGIDLNAAATLVGKAAAGDISSFTRYGIVIKKGATDAETFANAIQAINSKMGGAAAAQINTFSGATTQLSNQWADLTKIFGNSVIENQSVIDTVKAVTAMIRQWTESLGGNETQFKVLIAEGLIKAIECIQLLIEGLDAVTRIGKTAFESMIVPVKELVAGLEAARLAVSGHLAEAWDVMKQKSVAAIDSVKSAANGKTMLGSMADALGKLKDSAQAGLGAVKSGAYSVVEPLNQAASAVKKFSAEQVAMAQAGAKLAQNITAPGAAAKEETASLQAQHDAGILNTQQYYKKRQALALSQHKVELADLKAAHSQGLVNDQDYNNSVLASNQKYGDAITKLKAQQYKEQSQAQSDFLNLASSLSQSKNKELAAIGKAAAVTQIAIATPPAIAKSFDFGSGIGGPIVGGIFAGIAAAAMAVQAANIAGVPLATGIESVPGIGFTDQFPAMLAPKEGVLNARTNQDLISFLADNKNGRSQASSQVINQFHFHGPILDKKQSGLAIIEMLNSVKFSTGAKLA